MNIKQITLLLIHIFLLLSPHGAGAGQFCKADVTGDCAVNLEDLVQMKAEFLDPECEACSPPYPAPVAKTGQTTPYSVSDDGNYQAGVASPEPRFTDNEDGTVTDNLTGLMWTKDANIFGQIEWDSAINACDNFELANYTDWNFAIFVSIKTSSCAVFLSVQMAMRPMVIYTV